jgi:hypothetical protein
MINYALKMVVSLAGLGGQHGPEYAVYELIRLG